MKSTFLKLVVLSACFNCLAIAGAAEPEIRRVSVQGLGKVTAPPDIARFRIEVTEEGPRVEAVTQEVRKKMERVLKALKAQGIADKDIQTQAYRVAPKVEWQNGRSKRTGFTGSNQVEATVRELSKAGAVLAAALDAGANQVDGPQFEFANPQELERKALGLALQDAKAKAALLAEGAGATLGETLEIHEGDAAPPVHPMPMMKRMAMSAMAEASGPEPIAAGEEVTQASVRAVFALK
jgi:uncharacterized protein YggE